ncbi:MAG TPA: PAS domain S-box protein [Nevskiaceae bacterium]|nr:PAS domain S-box protein [Nevskiaceae bacterium]
MFDRGCRDLVDEVEPADQLRTLCAGIADTLGLRLVGLVRRAEGGLMRMEAASCENRLWAEFTRLPERWDGTIAGHGPAVQALQTREMTQVAVTSEGFLPWREAAISDGVARAAAWPLEVDDGEWVLVMFGGREVDFEEPPLREAGLAAAHGLERHLAAMQRLDRQRLLASALARAGNPAFIADVHGTIQWSNPAFSRLTGYAAAEVRGRNPRFLASGQHGPRYYQDLWNTIRTGNVWNGETVDRDRDGIAFTTMQTITPFGPADRVTHYVAIYEDITSQKKEQVRRALRSERDPLTNLMHAAALEKHMRDALALGKPVTLALVSLRNLARVVGRLGDDARESLLETFRARVREVVGADHAAATAAGEFLVRLPNEPVLARAAMQALKERLAEPYPQAGSLPDLEIRVAAAAAPANGPSVDALKRHADRGLGVEPLSPARRTLNPGP